MCSRVFASSVPAAFPRGRPVRRAILRKCDGMEQQVIHDPQHERCAVCGTPRATLGICERCSAFIRDLHIPQEMHYRVRCISIYIADVPVDQDGAPFVHGSGYRLWLFGVWYDVTPDDGPGVAIYAASFYPKGDRRRSTLPNAAPIGWIQAWLTRVLPDGSPLYAQRKWEPGTEASCDIRGYERKHTKRDRARAEYALELLTHVAELQPGRPRRDDDLALRIVHWFDDEEWTERQIAEHLGWHLSADEHGTPRRSARVQGYVGRGRELRMQEKDAP
jgi:hypothetical protein